MEIDYNRKLRLLLVDDVQVHRYLMATGIERINPFIKIDMAASLEEAIQQLSSNSYHAVISDWSMPGGGGGELIKWMRSRTHCRHVPFIMVSSKDSSQDIIGAFMELDVDAYVVKPFKNQDLYDKMMSVIEKRKQ